MNNYEQILHPDELIKEFNTMDCFKEWCEAGDELDLSEALDVFKAYELYEYCAVIKKVLDEK